MTRFEGTIPDEFQVPPLLCGAYSIKELLNIFKVAEFNEGFKVDGG
jgi:hypothetical protein